MDYFSTFIQMLHAKRLSDNTIRSYSTYIKAYLAYLGSIEVSPESASWQDLRSPSFTPPACAWTSSATSDAPTSAIPP